MGLKIIMIWDTISMLESIILNQTMQLFTPEELIKHWNIGLKTPVQILKAIDHQCICKVGLITKFFKTDKSQLLYE